MKWLRITCIPSGVLARDCTYLPAAQISRDTRDAVPISEQLCLTRLPPAPTGSRSNERGSCGRHNALPNFHSSPSFCSSQISLKTHVWQGVRGAFQEATLAARHSSGPDDWRGPQTEALLSSVNARGRGGAPWKPRDEAAQKAQEGFSPSAQSPGPQLYSFSLQQAMLGQ